MGGAMTPGAKAPISEKTEPAPQEVEPEKTLLVTPEQSLPEDPTVPNKTEGAPAEATVPVPEVTPTEEAPKVQTQTADAEPGLSGTELLTGSVDQVEGSDPAPEQQDLEKKDFENKEPILPETDLSKTSISIPV